MNRNDLALSQMTMAVFSEATLNIDWRARTEALWQKQKGLLLLFLITVLADFLSTVAFMSLVGIDLEMNLLVRFLSHHFGIIIGPFLGKCAQIVSVWGFSMLSERIASFVIAGLTLANVMAVIINTKVVIQALHFIG